MVDSILVILARSERMSFIMITVKILPGVCGLKTTVWANSDDMQNVSVEIESDCYKVNAIRSGLKRVDAFVECFEKIGEGKVYRLAREQDLHTSCPVPSAIIKAIETAARLALPKNVEIEIIDGK